MTTNQDASWRDRANRSRADALVRSARDDLERGARDSAMRSLKLALTFDPHHEEARDLLVRMPRARRPSERSVSQVEREAVLLYQRANDVAANGDVDEALRLLESAIDKSENAGFHNRLAVLLARRREFERAIAEAERAVALAPTNQTYVDNRSKILAAAATHEPRATRQRRGRGFLAGLLRRGP